MFDVSTDRARTIVNGSVALFILVFAEVFRRAVRKAAQERDREIATHELLLRELDHRIKNNFAMVSALLNAQQRHATHEEVREALGSASLRVSSFAAVHESIYRTDKYSETIDLREYLKSVCENLEKGLFQGFPVTLVLKCKNEMVERDHALSLGLIVNEIVTNAAKHAFPEGSEGQVIVAYEDKSEQPWCLSITDNGRVLSEDNSQQSEKGSGVGSQLLKAFAQRANGTLIIERLDDGTKVSLKEIIKDY